MNEVKNLPAPPAKETNPETKYPHEPSEVEQTFKELYRGASTLEISVKERDILEAPVDPTLIEIRPDGLLYLPQVFVRERLNAAFGPGQWAIIQNNISIIRDTLCFDGSLFVRNHFVSRAMGEANYIKTNKMQSWATVYESSKSDTIARTCKDLGVAKELWQPGFCRDWQKMNAIEVYRTNGPKSKGPGWYWRRKDVDPWYDEGNSDDRHTQGSDTRSTGPSGSTGSTTGGSKRQYRKCPKCNAVAIMKSKDYENQYYCNKRADGCGTTYLDEALTKEKNSNSRTSAGKGTSGSGKAEKGTARKGTEAVDSKRPSPDLRTPKEKKVGEIRLIYDSTRGSMFIKKASQAILFCASRVLKKAIHKSEDLKESDLDSVLETFKNKNILETILQDYKREYEEGK